MTQSELFMLRALELAKLGTGAVSPNPRVGCVIVHQDKIVGEGWHNVFGGPHAEVNAIESVVDKLRFFCDVLGFRFSDFNGHMNFIRCSSNHHSIALAKADGPSLNHVAFEMHDYDALMRGVGRMRMGEQELGWGVGRHAGPGRNIFSYFVDPNGYAIEYTADVDQVDDSYESHTAEYWQAMPLRPCSWAGAKTAPTARMREAMGGKLVEARNGQVNETCDDAISNKMAG
jgi:catechol 2,3-dioxygenase